MADPNGPEVGQDVFLFLESGELFSGRVDGLKESTLFLSASRSGGERVGDLAGEATLQFTSRRGVCRLDGVIRGRDPDLERLRFEPTTRVRVIQRREYVRIDAVVSVSFRPPRGDGPTVDTHTLNVSGGGFLLVERSGLEIGDTTEFSLHLSETENPLTVVGKAVRETAAGGLGIMIEEILQRDRERLIHWVFNRERVALKRR